LGGVVLDTRDTGHLDRELEHDSDKDSTEVGPVEEDLQG
jgi:hypothetical protein